MGPPPIEMVQKSPKAGRWRRLFLVPLLLPICVAVSMMWKEQQVLLDLRPYGAHAWRGAAGAAGGAGAGDAAAQYPAHRLGPDDDEVLPLPALTRSSEAAATACPRGLVPVVDTVLPLAVTHPPSRRVPRVVHVTSRSRCVTPTLRRHLEQWRRTANHSFFFHDDAAVVRLLRQGWLDRAFRTGRGLHETCPGHNASLPPGGGFARRTGCSWEASYLPNRPASEVALKCATAGATLADLWRYAVLYRYGGVYTDLDNGKGEKWRDDLIEDDDDFVGVVEHLGIIGQYWLASSPGHPYMRHTMDDALSHLRVTTNVMNNAPHKTTGPGAVKRGFCFFMEAAGGGTGWQRVSAGKYVGDRNRSVTVIGQKSESREYVNRAGLAEDKKMGYYKEVNITHFSRQGEGVPGGLSPGQLVGCEDHLRRTAGQPEKKADYVYNATVGKYVEVP